MVLLIPSTRPRHGPNAARPPDSDSIVSTHSRQAKNVVALRAAPPSHAREPFVHPSVPLRASDLPVPILANAQLHARDAVEPLRAVAEPGLQEVTVAATADGAYEALVALALGSAEREGLVLRVRDALSARETGRLHARGLARENIDPSRLIVVTARNAREALWVVEAGLLCPAIRAVAVETYGDAKALGFTATRRLAMAARRHRKPCLMVRLLPTAKATAAQRRWSIASASTIPDPHDDRAPGAPSWRLDLLRARDGQPASWTVTRLNGVTATERIEASEDEDVTRRSTAGITPLRRVRA